MYCMYIDKPYCMCPTSLAPRPVGNLEERACIHCLHMCLISVQSSCEPMPVNNN